MARRLHTMGSSALRDLELSGAYTSSIFPCTVTDHCTTTWTHFLTPQLLHTFYIQNPQKQRQQNRESKQQTLKFELTKGKGKGKVDTAQKTRNKNKPNPRYAGDR